MALRAGVSVAVPLLLLWAAGRLEWSIYASFGAFTALYGRERVDLPRLLLQGQAALGLVLAVTLGAVVAVSPERSWISVPVAAVVAAAAAYVSFARRWHPPGPIFFVFGFAAVASIPADWRSVPAALAVSGSAALFSVVVGNLGAAFRRRRRTAPLPARERPIGGAAGGAVRLALQSGLGVVVAGSVATAADIGRPYWAMVSAVVPLVSQDLLVQLTRGIHRIIGTGAGLVLCWALFALDLPALGAVVAVVLLQTTAELLVGRNYALALVVITPLALLMVHLVSPVPTGQLLVDRAVESVIGVVIGLAIGYATRPRARAR